MLIVNRPVPSWQLSTLYFFLTVTIRFPIVYIQYTQFTLIPLTKRITEVENPRVTQ